MALPTLILSILLLISSVLQVHARSVEFDFHSIELSKEIESTCDFEDPFRFVLDVLANNEFEKVLETEVKFYINSFFYSYSRVPELLNAYRIALPPPFFN